MEKSSALIQWSIIASHIRSQTLRFQAVLGISKSIIKDREVHKNLMFHRKFTSTKRLANDESLFLLIWHVFKN